MGKLDNNWIGNYWDNQPLLKMKFKNIKRFKKEFYNPHPIDV